MVESITKANELIEEKQHQIEELTKTQEELQAAIDTIIRGLLPEC